MNILIAMDSFKGSLSSLEAGMAVSEGIKLVYPEVNAVRLTLADGGEGTMETLTYGLGGEIVELLVTGPLGEACTAQYGVLPDGTAVIEMAKAAGLPLVPPSNRNPLYTTTYGVGELIRDAITKGCRSFIVGIGGSATNDGGIGMLQALGFEFWDEHGLSCPRGAIGLQYLREIRTEKAMKELQECRFRIACDVTTPLFGPQGCSAIFGPQKGADTETVSLMDFWLRNYACKVQELFPFADPNLPGAGAAGGLGFAFSVFLGGQLLPGAKMILDYLRIPEQLPYYRLIITGEGCLDAQSIMGKGPVTLARLAKSMNIPVLLFAGCVRDGAEVCKEYGVSAYYHTLPDTLSIEEAMKPTIAYRNLLNTVKHVMSLQETRDLLKCI